MKKRLTLTAALFACALATHAQTEKGKIILGGSIGLSHRTDKSQNPQVLETNTSTNQMSNYKSNLFSLGPNIGFFVKDNLALGLELGYGRSKATSLGIYSYYDPQTNNPIMNYASNETKYNLFWLNPYTRYYINLADKFKLFGQLSVPMSLGTQKNYNYSSTNSSSSQYRNSSIGVSAQPGFAFFPTKKISIEFSFGGLNYTHNSSKNKFTDEKSSSNDFGFNTNTSTPKLGFMFYL